MTHKEYELIAHLIMVNSKESESNEWDCYKQSEMLAIDLAVAFAQKYSNFDREKFLKACGIEVTNHV